MTKISSPPPAFRLPLPADKGQNTDKPTARAERPAEWGVNERRHNIASGSTSSSTANGPQSPDAFREALDNRLAFYQTYIRYGCTPADVDAALKVLQQSLLADPRLTGDDAERFQRLAAQLTQLADRLPPLADTGMAALARPDEINRQHEAAATLISATSTVHGMLARTDDGKRLAEAQAIKTALLEELLQGALRRMMKQSPAAVETESQQQAFTAQCRAYLAAPCGRVDYLLQRFLAEGERQLQKAPHKALEQQHRDVQRQLTQVQQFTERWENGELAGYPVDTDVIFLLRQASDQLSALLPPLEIRISTAAPVAKPPQHLDWLSGSGMNPAVPLSSAYKFVCAGLHTAGKHLKRLHSTVNHEGVAPFQVNEQRAFLSLSDTERRSALALKAQFWPVLSRASLLQQAAEQLEAAIVNARREGTHALPVVTRVREALMAELLALEKATPLAQLMQAVERAEALALEVLNQPSSRAAASEITDLLQEYAAGLDEAGLKLLTAVRQAQTHFQAPGLVADVKAAKKMARDVHSALNNALESRSGVTLQDHYGWLQGVERDLRIHWQAIAALARKGRRIYRLTANEPCTRAAAGQSLAIQLAGMHLLHETARILLLSQRLQAAVQQMTNDGEEQLSVVNRLAQQMTGTSPDAIAASAGEIRRRLATISPAVCLLETGTDTQPVALTALLDNQLNALMQAEQQLRQAAWLALWAPTGKTVQLSLVRLKGALTGLKADLKEAIAAASGVAVDNNALPGMVAKDAAEWLVRQHAGQAGENGRQIALHRLSEAFKTDDDPTGELFRLRTTLAMRDVAAGEISWPVSAQEWLAATPSAGDYMLSWAEKRLTYGMLYNVVMHYTPAAMFSPQMLKNSLVSPLRLINFLLTPIRMVAARRAMEKVRPGEARSPELLAQYQFRAYSQALFRLLSMLAPQLVKTLAATLIAGYGLMNQREYRENFLARAESRLPGDLFWVGTFSALREAAELFSPSGGVAEPPFPPLVNSEEATPQTAETHSRTRRAIAATNQNGLPDGEENSFRYQPWFTAADNVRSRPDLSTFTRNVAREFPDLRELASSRIKHAIKEKYGLDLDPDNTYLHTFRGGASNSASITGWSHNGMPTRSQTLTQLVMQNFSAHHWDDPNLINAFAAVYDVPADARITDQFLNKLPLPLRPSDLAPLVWDIDLYPQYISLMQTFWAEHGEHYKIALHASLIHQVGIEQPDLGDEGTDMVFSALGMPTSTKTAVTCDVFDINGYLASDMMVIQSKSSASVVLYLPRAGQKFRFFSNSDKMRDWVVAQCADDNTRSLIAAHFAIKERMDGPTIFGKWGVDSWLKNIQHYKSSINSVNTTTDDDMITTLASRQRDRVIEDADNLIKSDSEVQRDMWIRGIDTLGTFIPNPVTPFISLGLDIEKAKNADDDNERKVAVSGIGSNAFQIAIIAVSSAFGKFVSLKFDIDELAETRLPYGGAADDEAGTARYLAYKNMARESVQAAIDNPLTAEEAAIVDKLSVPLSPDTSLKQCAKPHPSYPTVYDIHLNSAQTPPRRCIEIAGKFLPLRQYTDGTWEVYNPQNAAAERYRVVLDRNNRFVFYRPEESATTSNNERVKIYGQRGRDEEFFRPPQKMANGKIGYLLSPETPPRLPDSGLTLSEKYESWRNELCPDAVSANTENSDTINLVATNEQGEQSHYRFPARPLQSVKSEVDYYKTVSNKVIDKTIKLQLENDYGKGNHRITKFTDAMKEDGGMRKKLAEHIQNAVLGAYEQTTFLSEQLSNPQFRPAIAERLMKSLKITDPRVLESTVATFKENLDKLALKLKHTIDKNFSTIYLVSPENEDSVRTRPIAIEALTPPADPQGRIYFNTHAQLVTTRMDVVGIMPIDKAFLADIDEPARHRFLLLHEYSHAALKTEDYFYVRNLRENWLPPSIDELNTQFGIKLSKGQLGDDFYLDAIGKDLDKSWEKDPRTLTSREKNIAEQMVRADPMLKMKLLLNNADTQAILIDDLYTHIHPLVESAKPLPASAPLPPPTPENSATGCCTVSR